MAIEGFEMPDSPDESRDAKGLFTAKCNFMVPWGYRYDFINEHHLELYPRAPWTQARCMSESCKPFQTTQLADGTTTTPQLGAPREYAIVTLNYTSNAPETKDLITESIEPNAEFITLDHNDFTWANGDPLKDGEAPGRLLKGCDYILTFHEVYSIPSWVYDLIDCVNGSQFASRLLGSSWAAETLLYNPPKVSRKITSDTSKPTAWSLELKLSYKKEGWNKFWRAKTQSYERMKRKSDGSSYNNFELANFGTIWVL